jgi:hypothetical protein
LLFPDLAEAAPQKLLDGSAKLALQVEPRFDKYIFIERSPERCQRLEDLKTEFPALANDIDVRQGEANEVIQKLCADPSKWKSRHAVLYLGPYGMQVEWKTIEAVAVKKAIDLWLLVPSAWHEPPRAEVRQGAGVVPTARLASSPKLAKPSRLPAFSAFEYELVAMPVPLGSRS